MKKIEFTVQTRINKPINETFDAIVDQKKLESYFVRSSTAPIKEGSKITWAWSKEEQADVYVKNTIQNESILLEWSPSEKIGYLTTVLFTFESLEENKTLVKIKESGWTNDEEGLKSSFDNCSGWEHMLACMKARLEHDIDIR